MARGFVYTNFSKCLLALGILSIIYVPLATALAKNDLYPYAGSGSSVLATDANGQLLSSEATLATPIAFYERIYKSIFINANGVLSFARAMQRWFNIAFPLDDPVIAPLYTHVDTRGSGTVYWSETDSQEILDRAGSLIRASFRDAQDFVPTHVFIATWVDVGYYNERSDKVNTYQVAISSNGNKSYVELLYPENGIQWIQGESHPSGLPDAKAQVGFMSEGRMYTLKGSGTDQIQNLDKWSNINRPGQWLFQVGPITDGEDVKTPDNVDDSGASNQISTCRTGATTCHSKAECVDYESGFCCSCKEGYFGNGKACQPNDIPLRVIGRISGTINGIEVPSRDLQCYVQTRDGRTYTAVSRVPGEIGASFQLLNQLGGTIGWLFAKPVSDTKNGYQLTGGTFNQTAELNFISTGDSVTIRSTYMGLDVFGQLKMEAEITGTLPTLAKDTRVDYSDHDELYTRAGLGMIRSQSERACKLIQAGGEERDCRYKQDQTITFQECAHGKMDDEDTTRLKFYRGVTKYEDTEGIIRIAVNTKIAPLEEEDPCIQGRATCGAHSSCIVDGDDFKCVCNPGYQYLYEEDGSAICVDVNECTAGNHVCSPDAQCINQEGSHTCECRPGFVGDGRNCERSPTCEDIRCTDYEQCVMVNDQPNCICGPGYQKTPEGCYPDNRESCDVEDNCSPNALCNYDGDKKKHMCVCLPGYVGDGYTCYPEGDAVTQTDEPPRPQCAVGMCWCPSGWEYRNGQCFKQDEESTDVGTNDTRDLSCNVVNRCHPYAQCIYVANTGDYECRCNLGYEGDGMECTKTEVSCLEVDICDPNASCRHEEPFAKCVCNPGYEGDGTICSPIDECSTDSDCNAHEKCNYNPTNSRYQCTCDSGYTMVDGQCIVSDCATNPSQCHLNAQCVSNREGGYKCMCVAGYHGDGMNQCIEDHIGCSNCGVNAVCGYNQTGGNYACMCEPGYRGDGFTCIRQVSCVQDPNLCSRDAVCKLTSPNQYACVCNEEYIGDGINCKPRPEHDSNFLLVNQGMATLRIPFEPTNENRGSPIYIAYTQMAIALDIDCLNGRAYSSDITGNRIVELTYNGSLAETFLINVTSPEGLSIDWVARNIFWTDSGKGTLEVANLVTKKRKVLISEGLVNPRGIAVHPYRGKIFWSDWNRAAPKLEWANEDGTGRAIFLQGDYVKLPNSLSIDWSTDELCWTDAGTMTITCIEIDSKEISVAVNQLSYPFGLAISPNHYYWTDWKTHKIEVAMKNSGERKTAISIPPGGNGKLYGIVVVPESCPRVSNVCQYENGRCNQDQLCLPDGQGGRTCVCADDATGPCQDLRYPS